MFKNIVRRAPVLLVLVCFLGITACSNSPTGRHQLLLVSDEEMVKLGQNAFEEIKGQSRLVEDAKKKAYVRCVTNALLAELPAEDAKGWEVEIFEDETPNAFALPGRRIGVHTGMLKIAKTPAQLAAVIGHEIGHVQAKHGAERMSMNTVTNLRQTIIATVLDGNEYRNTVTGVLGIGAEYGVLLPYSRKHETEADNIGLNMMAKAGFMPSESITLWKNMSKANESAPPEFFSTHPANSTRIAGLEQNLEQANKLYKQAISNGIQPMCKL